MSTHTVRTTLQPDVDLLVGDKELENLRLLGVLLPAEPPVPAAATSAPPADTVKAPADKAGRRTDAAT